MSTSSAPLTPQQLFYLCQPPNILSLKCPGAAPPLGQVPLDPNGPTIMPVVIGVCTACSFLILASTSIRFYARIFLIKKFGLEDGLLLASVVIYFIFIGFYFSATPNGLGKHTWDITLFDLLAVVRRQYPSQILYSLYIYPAKMSVIVQILRIFDSKHGRKQDLVYWGSWSMIVFITAYSLALLLTCIFPCTPIRRLWEPTLPGTCLSPMVPGVISAVGNLTSDLIVLCLPALGLRKLQMRTKKKIAVSAVFATGLLACGLAVVRLYFIAQNEHMKNDYMQWVTVEALLAIVEGSAITVCCCFPLFPVFWKHIRQSKMKGWNTTAQSESYQLSKGHGKVGHVGKHSGSSKYWDMSAGGDKSLSKGESQEHITTAVSETS